MPIALNEFVNIINDNLKISDYTEYLTPKYQAFITTFTKENIALLLDLISQIQLIETNGVVSLLDTLTVVLILDKIVKELVRAKKAVRIKHLNVIRFLLETLGYSLLKFPAGVAKDDVRLFITTSLEILKTSPKVKVSCSKIFFGFGNVSNHDEILYYIRPVYQRHGTGRIPVSRRANCQTCNSC